MPPGFRAIGSAILSIVALVPSVSGFAQADTHAQRDRLLAVRASSNVVRLYVPAADDWTDDVSLPPNLVVPPLYRDTVDTMYRRSATFRRQCSRIARASQLTVTLATGSPNVQRQASAWTRIVRNRTGRLEATVQIGSGVRAPELIAHELEHIIEQLDGIDLPAMARLPSSGVHQCECGYPRAYETSRAVQIGLQVAREVRGVDR